MLPIVEVGADMMHQGGDVVVGESAIFDEALMRLDKGARRGRETVVKGVGRHAGRS